MAFVQTAEERWLEPIRTMHAINKTVEKAWLLSLALFKFCTQKLEPAARYCWYTDN